MKVLLREKFSIEANRITVAANQDPYATKARIRIGKMSTPQIATEAQAIDTQAMTMGGHPKASRHRRTS